MWTGENFVLAPGCDPFFQALDADPTAYRAAATQLLDGPFAEATLDAQIDQHAAFIRSAAAADPYGPGAAGFDGAVQYLKNMVPTLRARLELLRDGGRSRRSYSAPPPSTISRRANHSRWSLVRL